MLWFGGLFLWQGDDGGRFPIDMELRSVVTLIDDEGGKAGQNRSTGGHRSNRAPCA